MPPTKHQTLGNLGESAVARLPCPRCKRRLTLKRLPKNFKCADIICDFCGYLAQVKTTTRSDIDQLPKSVLGAAWGPQKNRMDAGVFIPLFIVVISPNHRSKAIYYLPADLQVPQMFKQRKALSKSAKRAGWVGCNLVFGDDGAIKPVRIQ